MTLELTDKAKNLLSETNIENQLILDIEGIPFIYGAVDVERIWRIGDEGVKIGDPGLKIGGVITDPTSKPYISLDGSTRNLTIQLEVDKGGAGGVQKFNVVLVDKDEHVTQNLRR